MPEDFTNVPVPGWIGGFAQSDPHFAYPDPELGALPLLDNMANIARLQRQQAVLWPEFSWQSVPGDESSRCYQMFAPDISRIGYTDEGRVYSIICPQQGACSPAFGCLNVEVTVTGQRGWVDETARTMAADMTVTGKVWFSPSAKESGLVRMLWHAFEALGSKFPHDKAHAIEVATHLKGDPSQPVFPLRKGETDAFAIPDFARHPEAWDVANLLVEIGPVAKTGDPLADAFNALVMEAFNAASGNLLLEGNTLAWNVWFAAPALVDRAEWQAHAERWRKSIDADHGSPGGKGTAPRHFDGSPFRPLDSLLEEEAAKIWKFIRDHLRG
ncbi:hypothetical protein [Mangrovicoccus sp. HB161399]|uniref:hypothetical protein n=1 Tax=Mangrovicoccus sp. HB161399 TaxID=2720392 RepID=UPI0015525B39|nr:hypothetical protein [Mangrovicoccus sp. HB161399]